MANVQFTNYALAAANDAFSAIWKLSRALKKAGWTYKASGTGTGSGAPETSGVATADLWGGNADPALDSYPSFGGVSTWWCAQGPSTVKIPFTVASTGTFLRGEKITQAVSLAEGELIGYEYDGASAGHLVVLPRVGTFDNTNLITGAGSGATLTPSGTIDTFVREIVIQKSSANLTAGSIIIQCVSSVTETASRFSTLAVAAGCTNSICPGGGGVGNAYPTTGTWTICGAFSSGAAVHGSFFGVNTNLGRAQIVATNIITATNVSADGTFWIGCGVTSTSTKFNFWGYFRMDNSEDGDLDPFVSYKASNNGYNNVNLQKNSSDMDIAETSVNLLNYQNQNDSWKAWRRRGFGTDEQIVCCYAAVFAGVTISAVSAMAFETSTAETVACTYSTKRVREPITLISTTSTKKTRKGTVRWMHQVQGGTTFDTYDSKVRMAVMAPSTFNASIIMGPYDGTTSPLQS